MCRLWVVCLFSIWIQNRITMHTFSVWFSLDHFCEVNYQKYVLALFCSYLSLNLLLVDCARGNWYNLLKDFVAGNFLLCVHLIFKTCLLLSVRQWTLLVIVKDQSSHLVYLNKNNKPGKIWAHGCRNCEIIKKEKTPLSTEVVCIQMLDF